MHTRLQTGRPSFDSRKGQGLYFFTMVSRPVLGPIQPPIQLVPGLFPRG